MSQILENLTKKLNACGIHTLRQLGRAVGVYSPTNKKKEELIADIIAIASDRADPAEVNHRGAPPKSEEYDKDLLAEVERCRRYYAGLTPDMPAAQAPLPSGVASPSAKEAGEVFSGVLENDDKFWFVRTRDMQICPEEDVFVHSSFITRFKLRAGDFIVCKAARRAQGEPPAAEYIVSVNGVEPESLCRVPFESLTPCYPDKRLTLEYEGCSLTERAIDLFSPVGRGQRALVFSPPKAGKTTLLRHIALAITKNHPDYRIIAALIDGRPEEVSDFSEALKGAEITYSTFDRGDSYHIRTANLALARAKSIAESGGNAVLLLDGITALSRAHANLSQGSGTFGASGTDFQALMAVKRYFGAARNTSGGGSLTIIAAAVIGTGSEFDDAVCEELRFAANMEISLSAELARGRVFPAMDILSSGARREDLLLSPGELDCVCAVRSSLAEGLGARDVFGAMSHTQNNAEFVRDSAQILQSIRNDR